MSAVPGIYKRSLQGFQTFVPDPLPPPLVLSPAVARTIEEATHLLGQVEVLSLRQITDQANMARYSAQAALNILRDHDLVYEITGKEKGRVYACRPVITAIFGPASPPP